MAAPYTSDWFFTAEKTVKISQPVGSPLVSISAPARVAAFDPYIVTWRLAGEAELLDPPTPYLVWDTVSHPFDVDYAHRVTGAAAGDQYQASLNAPWQLGKVYVRAVFFLRQGGEARWFYSEEAVITITAPIQRVRQGLR